MKKPEARRTNDSRFAPVPQLRSSTGILFWIPTVWLICLTIVSLQPVRLGVARSGTGSHLILHVMAFGFPAFLLLMRNISRTRARAEVLGILWLATFIELAQHWMYGNPFEWADLFADGLGLVIAVLLGTLRGRVGDSL